MTTAQDFKKDVLNILLWHENSQGVIGQEKYDWVANDITDLFRMTDQYQESGEDYYRQCENCGDKFWTKYPKDTLCTHCFNNLNGMIK